MGYAAFAEQVTAEGESPTRLAGDLPALLAFFSSHRQLIGDDRMLQSAAIFLGNTLVLTHPRAEWRRRNELEVGTRTRSIPVLTAVRMLTEHPERHNVFLEQLQTWQQDDEDHDELHQFTRNDDKHDVVLELPAEPFQRPSFPDQVYLDDAGDPIPYGDSDRWADEAPPDAYGRVTDEDRFAPLQAEVDALVAYLARTCDVRITHQIEEDGERVFTLTPARGAPVRIVSSPTSVLLEAGALFKGWYPSCSCDACNEDAAGAAENLEEALFDIVGGGLRERYAIGRRHWAQTSLQTLTGRIGSAGPLDADRDNYRDRAHLRLQLAALDDGSWLSWPSHTEP